MAVVLLAAGLVAADDPMLEIEASPSTVRLGDRIEMRVAARGGEGLMWGELSVVTTPDGPWAVAGGPTAVAGARPPVWELTLVPLELGDQQLPAVRVSARPADGDATEVTAASTPTVSVVSVLTDDGDGSGEPAPLRDPIGVRGFPWEWVVPAVAILLPLFGGAILWRRARQRTPESGRRLLPPLAELEALAVELEERVGREPADGICDRLAAGLRRYLERRTGEPAAEMTSFELRLLARRRGWPESAQRLVQRVMSVADGVRFGRRPSADRELLEAISGAVDAARAVEKFLAEADDERRTAEAGR